MAGYHPNVNAEQKKPPSRAPLWLAAAGFILVLIAVWGILTGGRLGSLNLWAKSGPRLKVEQDTIDRGNVKLGTTVQDFVRVTNVGDLPLRFIEAPYVEVKEGC